MSGDITRDERPRCGDCGGLGATVVTYPVKDENGYEYTAQRDKPCDTCHGTGRV